MKRFFSITVLAITLMATPALAQTPENVKKEENKFIYSNSILLFLGDSIHVQSNNKGKNLTDFTLITKLKNSSGTISIKFTYDKFGKNYGSLLKVTNPFSKQLIYKARVRYKPLGKYTETSIFPVEAKIYGMEMWPEKLESIILYDFELK
jgi:hypothetical protein